MRYLILIPVLLLFSCKKEKCHVCKSIIAELAGVEVRSRDSVENIYCDVDPAIIAGLNTTHTVETNRGNGVVNYRMVITKCEEQ